MNTSAIIELIPILCVTITAISTIIASVVVTVLTNRNALKLEEKRQVSNVDVELRSKRSELLLSWYNILNGTCKINNNKDAIETRISGFLTPTTVNKNVKVMPLSDLLQQTLIYTDDQNIVILIGILMESVTKHITKDMSNDEKKDFNVEKGLEYSIVSSMIFKRLLKKWNDCDVEELFVFKTTLINDLSKEQEEKMATYCFEVLKKLK